MAYADGFNDKNVLGTIQGVVGKVSDLNSLYQNSKVLAPSLGLKSKTPLLFPLLSYSAEGKPTGCNTLIKDSNHSLSEVEQFIRQYTGKTLQLTKINKVNTSGYCTFSDYSVISTPIVNNESKSTSTTDSNTTQPINQKQTVTLGISAQLAKRMSFKNPQMESIASAFNLSSDYPLRIGRVNIQFEGKVCNDFYSDKYKTYEETKAFYKNYAGQSVQLLNVRKTKHLGFCLFDTAVPAEPQKTVNTIQQDIFIGDITVSAKHYRAYDFHFERPFKTNNKQCQAIQVSGQARKKIKTTAWSKDFMNLTFHGVTLKRNGCYAEGITLSKEAIQHDNDPYTRLTGNKTVIHQQLSNNGGYKIDPIYRKSDYFCDTLHWREAKTAEEKENQNIVKSANITGKEVTLAGLEFVTERKGIKNVLITCTVSRIAVKGIPSTY